MNIKLKDVMRMLGPQGAIERQRNSTEKCRVDGEGQRSNAEEAELL